MNYLIAKSKPQISLVDHINDCLNIQTILSSQFDISKISNIPKDFWNLVRVSMIFHDLGKGHVEFQKLLNDQPNDWKSQRHELFSLPFFLAYGGIADKNIAGIILLAIAGHHKDFNQLFGRYISKYNDSESKGSYDLNLGNTPKFSFVDEFKKVKIDAIKDLLKEDYKIELAAKPEGYLNQINSLVPQYLTKGISIKDKDYWFLVLLFGAIKNCDHMGSAGIREIANISLQDFSFLNVYQSNLINRGLDFYSHQKSCSVTLGNVILTAPTGSGKTESAFLWLRKHFSENQTGRIFYVLPFTASINAMFERLVNVIDREKVGMLHGKLSAYLNNYFENHQYSQNSKKEAINALKQKFKYVTTPIKVCTPFQLLKHLFGLKGFEQGLFEWTNGYFIFDEIHAYDPRTFAQIKVLLEFVTENLNVKIMVMTATLPKFLREERKLSIGHY
ncbi:MAG TPA: CRISPR-associated helicase Cas3', partial [Cytophagaceae bacterium]